MTQADKAAEKPTKALQAHAQAVANDLIRAVELHDFENSSRRPAVIFAYRYAEPFADGSQCAVYALENEIQDGGKPLVRVKAFADVESASAWSPRVELGTAPKQRPAPPPEREGDTDFSIG